MQVQILLGAPKIVMYKWECLTDNMWIYKHPFATVTVKDNSFQIICQNTSIDWVLCDSIQNAKEKSLDTLSDFIYDNSKRL